MQVVFTVKEPRRILKEVKEYLRQNQYKLEENQRKHKIIMSRKVNKEEMKIKMKILEVNEETYCLKLQKIIGDTMSYWEILEEIRTKLCKE